MRSHIDLQYKQTETQGIVQKIVADLEELTRRLNNYMPANESTLGELRGEMMFEVTNWLIGIEQKVTQLIGELEKQTKSAPNNSGLLLDLMVGIENLGDDMKKIVVYWKSKDRI